MSFNENRETNMDVNKEIPQTDEKALENLTTDELFKVLEDAQTEVQKSVRLAEKILLTRWKSKMFEACQNGRTKIVKMLLEHCNCEESGWNVKDEFGRTPLMMACQNGHKDVVKLFLERSNPFEKSKLN